MCTHTHTRTHIHIHIYIQIIYFFIRSRNCGRSGDHLGRPPLGCTSHPSRLASQVTRSRPPESHTLPHNSSPANHKCCLAFRAVTGKNRAESASPTRAYLRIPLSGARYDGPQWETAGAAHPDRLFRQDLLPILFRRELINLCGWIKVIKAI